MLDGSAQYDALPDHAPDTIIQPRPGRQSDRHTSTKWKPSRFVSRMRVWRLCATAYLLAVLFRRSTEHGQQVGRGTPERRLFSNGTPKARHSISC